VPFDEFIQAGLKEYGFEEDSASCTQSREAAVGVAAMFD
jgi:hypothetical protein